MKNIVIVDEADNVVGSEEISRAYELNQIVRISRTFVLNSKNELLLQKRAKHVKSCPDLWDHSASGHV